jgi:thioredoxin-like negative regulator of GroEL
VVLKLDTDANPKIAGRYGIRGIPTLIVFDKGTERGRHVGVANLETLQKLVGAPAG